MILETMKYRRDLLDYQKKSDKKKAPADAPKKFDANGYPRAPY